VQEYQSKKITSNTRDKSVFDMCCFLIWTKRREMHITPKNKLIFLLIKSILENTNGRVRKDKVSKIKIEILNKNLLEEII